MSVKAFSSPLAALLRNQATALVLAAVLAATVASAKPGNGKPGDGTGPTFEYHAVDLGNLGGPYASRATVITEDGDVAGASSTYVDEGPNDYEEHAFLLSPIDGDTWFQDTKGVGANELMVDLGDLGGIDSSATDANALRQVVGCYYFQSEISGEYTRQGFIWNNGVMTSLGAFIAAGYSDEASINDDGVVVGYATDDSAGNAFIIVPEKTDPDGAPDTWFQDDGPGGNALMTNLGRLGGIWASAADISNAGYVVGTSHIDEVDAKGNYLEHAFIIVPADKDGDGAPDTWYESENADGVNDLMIDLGTLGGANSLWGVAINDEGQIAGTAETASGENHAFLLTPEDTDGDEVPDTWFRDSNGDGANDMMVDLGVLDQMTYSGAWALNNQGQVVGYSGKRNGPHIVRKYFIWEDGVMRNLDTLTDIGTTVRDPRGINDAGQIVTEGGYILLPVQSGQ